MDGETIILDLTATVTEDGSTDGAEANIVDIEEGEEETEN